MTLPDGAAGWGSSYHAPALVPEVLASLGLAEGVPGRYLALDCTLGGGGHSAALLAAGAEVFGIDRDPEAIAAARQRLGDAERGGRFHAVAGNYADVDQLPPVAGLRFQGIVLDLGISSHQIDDATRGFTFREGAALDMRMEGQRGGEDAAGFLNDADEQELARVFRDYGDEPRASRLAREVVRRRAARPFATSDDLVRAIRGALGARSGPGDFARLFQAVRVQVNDELGDLTRALPALRDRLVAGGVLAVIAYHSGEDRLVKHAMREWSARCVCPPRQPTCSCRGRPLGALLTRKAVVAGDRETAVNPRARSARLRAWRSGE